MGIVATHQVDTVANILGCNKRLREQLDWKAKTVCLEGPNDQELLEAIVMPEGESSLKRWLAIKAIDCYNDATILWSVLSNNPSHKHAFGPGQGFPIGVVYNWSTRRRDEEYIHTDVLLSAPEYVEKVLDWVASAMDECCVFTDVCGETDDSDDAAQETHLTMTQISRIFRRLFRVYAILYTPYFFGKLRAMGMARHLNTCFKHFIFCCSEFRLLPEQQWNKRLEAPTEQMRAQYLFASTAHEAGDERRW